MAISAPRRRMLADQLRALLVIGKRTQPRGARTESGRRLLERKGRKNTKHCRGETAQTTGREEKKKRGAVLNTSGRQGLKSDQQRQGGFNRGGAETLECMGRQVSWSKRGKNVRYQKGTTKKRPNVNGKGVHIAIGKKGAPTHTIGRRLTTSRPNSRAALECHRQLGKTTPVRVRKRRVEKKHEETTERSTGKQYLNQCKRFSLVQKRHL